MTQMNDLGNVVTRTMDDTTARVHRAIERATDAARPAVDQLMHAPAQLTRSCRNYVHEKPMTSLGIALASGFLLSWMLQRR